MKLYLGSCDLGTHQKELKFWIKNHGKDIVLIPNALDIIYNNSMKQDMIDSDKQMLENVGFNVRVESLKNYFGKYQELKDCFDKYKAFYTIGGNIHLHFWIFFGRFTFFRIYDKYISQCFTSVDI